MSAEIKRGKPTALSLLPVDEHPTPPSLPERVRRISQLISCAEHQRLHPLRSEPSSNVKIGPSNSLTALTNVLSAESRATMPVSSRSPVSLLGPGSNAPGLADRTGAAPEAPPSAAEERASRARVLRLPQVCHRVGLCRSMIYRLESEGRFPRRIKLGLRAVGWIESEVEAWIRERAERSRNDTRTETR